MISSSPGDQMPGGFPIEGEGITSEIPEGETRGRQPPRRTSFNFLRRGKSVERLNSKRSISGGKLSKKQAVQAREQELLQQQREAPTPKLPDIVRAPQLQTFGGEEARPDSVAIISNKAGGYNAPSRNLPRGVVDMTRSNVPHNVPIPPIPGNKKAPKVDPYSRTESMTNRGRYSYASSAISTINSPRRVRRRKDPTPFNILVIGAQNSGKTSFLEFLRTSLALPARQQRPAPIDDGFDFSQYTSTRVSTNFRSHYLETEMDDGERVGLTLWDSEGLEKSIVDLQLREMTSFIESKFEDSFNQEMKVVRSPNARDTHIHCVFLILDPIRLDSRINAAKKAKEVTNGINFTNGKSYIQPASPGDPSCLDEDLDLQVLRMLQGKTTVVPVISKADTITTSHMARLKRSVWDSLRKANLDPLEALGLDDANGDDSDTSSSEDRTPVKTKHDSKHFDERDEDDAYLRPQAITPDPSSGRHSSITSHLDSASSSSNSPSPSRRTGQRLAQPHSRHSSSAFPPPPLQSQNSSTPYLPLSILSPDMDDPDIVGRAFPWGTADPYNPDHCDFVRLKEAVFREWRGELREASRELWYEAWRTSRLNGREKARTQVGIAR